MVRTKRAHFVTRDDVRVERFPWGPHDWLSRPDLVDSPGLLLVRIHMKKGQGCPFHLHPTMEEAVYVLHGVAEQWVGEEVRLLEAGEMAHIPRDTVHATFNSGGGVLRVLSVLSAAKAKEPALVDMAGQEPWRSISLVSTGDLVEKRRALARGKKAVRCAEAGGVSPASDARGGPARKDARGSRAAKTARSTGKASRGKKRG